MFILWKWKATPPELRRKASLPRGSMVNALNMLSTGWIHCLLMKVRRMTTRWFMSWRMWEYPSIWTWRGSLSKGSTSLIFKLYYSSLKERKKSVVLQKQTVVVIKRQWVSWFVSFFEHEGKVSLGGSEVVKECWIWCLAKPSLCA